MRSNTLEIDSVNKEMSSESIEIPMPDSGIYLAVKEIAANMSSIGICFYAMVRVNFAIGEIYFFICHFHPDIVIGREDPPSIPHQYNIEQTLFHSQRPLQGRSLHLQTYR